MPVHRDMPHPLNSLYFPERAFSSEKRPVTGRSICVSVPLSDVLSCLKRGLLQTWFIPHAAVSTRICELPVKLDLCKGSISIWWFYLSVVLHAKNKCCKKYEMRSHFPHGSFICCMRWHDIVSLLYISHLILDVSLPIETQIASSASLIVSRSKPQTYYSCTSFVFVLFIYIMSFEIRCVLCCMIFAHVEWRNRQIHKKRQVQRSSSSPICCFLSLLASF